MTNKKKICILLTATIRPGDVPEVALASSFVRERQYYEALSFYVKTKLPIVFCENSNTESIAIQSLGQSQQFFEYLFFSTNESFKGKGHGEKEIFDYAFANSTLIKNADWVIKISGRYIIENIDKVIHELKSTGEADVIANIGRNFTWADTRLMMFRRNFYNDYFKPCAEKYLNEKDKIFFERVFARSINQLLADGGKFLLWSRYPIYKGINGANGELIKFTFLRKIKFNFYYRFKRWVLKQIV